MWLGMDDELPWSISPSKVETPAEPYGVDDNALDALMGGLPPPGIVVHLRSETSPSRDLWLACRCSFPYAGQPSSLVKLGHNACFDAQIVLLVCVDANVDGAQDRTFNLSPSPSSRASFASYSCVWSGS